MPAGTPKEIVACCLAELKAALADPTVQQKMLGAGNGGVLDAARSARHAHAGNDYAKWGKVIKDNNIKSRLRIQTGRLPSSSPIPEQGGGQGGPLPVQHVALR